MARSIFQWARIRRGLLSPISGVHIFLYLAVLVSCMAFLYQITRKSQADFMAAQTVSRGHPMIIFIVIILIVGLVLLAIQTYAEYMKKTYDPTLALEPSSTVNADFCR